MGNKYSTYEREIEDGLGKCLVVGYVVTKLWLEFFVYNRPKPKGLLHHLLSIAVRISRPNRTVGRPRAEIRTRDWRSRSWFDIPLYFKLRHWVFA